MTINYAKKAIELTSAEYKDAQQYGSDMYKQVREARKDFPDFEVVEVKDKAKKSKNDFSDLTMKDIKGYVEKHGDDEQKEHFAFISKRQITEDGEYVEARSFFEIKMWFLEEFSELKKARKVYREKIEEIYAAAKAKAAA